MSWPMVAAAGVSGLASIVGQERANRINVQEAQRNRDWQRNMRDTQWQAAVRDMEAAGINPALAYSQGPNRGGSGAQAQVSDSLGPGVSSALAVKTAQEQFELMRAQRKKAQAETRKTGAEADIAYIQRAFEQGRMGHYFTGSGQLKPAMIELLESTHSGNIAGNSRAVAEMERARLSIPEMRAIAELFEKVGDEGKGLQMIMPLLTTILRGR